MLTKAIAGAGNAPLWTSLAHLTTRDPQLLKHIQVRLLRNLPGPREQTNVVRTARTARELPVILETIRDVVDDEHNAWDPYTESR